MLFNLITVNNVGWDVFFYEDRAICILGGTEFFVQSVGHEGF